MRKFTLREISHDVTEHNNDLKTVLETIPDLENDEIEGIVSLQVGESLTLDNSVIIRTM